MAEPGRVRWDPDHQNDEFYARLRRKDAPTGKPSTDQQIYLQMVADQLDNRERADAVVRWLRGNACEKIRKAFTTLYPELAETVLAMGEKVQNEKEQTGERPTTQTARTPKAERSGDAVDNGPRYVHPTLGVLYAKDLAALSEENRKTLFADIAGEIQRQENLKAVDAFLGERTKTVAAAWSKYLEGARPAYGLSADTIIDLPAEDKRAVFAQAQSDLGDPHFAIAADKFIEKCGENEELKDQWEHFVKTDEIADAEGLWIEGELWQALGFGKPQGRFSKEGMKIAKTDPDLMTAAMATLHRLRKANQPKVVPWLKANPKVNSAFDRYLRKLKGLQRSYSRTDGNTRQAPSAEFTNEQRKRSEKKGLALGERVRRTEARRSKAIQGKGRWSMLDEDIYRRVQDNRFWNHFVQTSKLGSQFIRFYRDNHIKIDKFSSSNKAKFLKCMAELLLDPTWADQAEQAISDLIIKVVGDPADYSANREPLRQALHKWVTENVADPETKGRVLLVIATVKAKGPKKVTLG